jgi:hypothetical protein
LVRVHVSRRTERFANEEARRIALRIASGCPVTLGPAIVVDIAKPGIRNAVIAYVLPQLEGREPKKVAADISSLATASGVSTSTTVFPKCWGLESFATYSGRAA